MNNFNVGRGAGTLSKSCFGLITTFGEGGAAKHERQTREMNEVRGG